jgi:hypothetical protein
MSWKGDIFRESSLRRRLLAIIILCTSCCWASADALAQESAPAQLKMTAPLTLWSLGGPESTTAPHLVIGMADRRDTPSYGPLRLVRDEAANPFAKNTISRTHGPVTYVNRAEKRESGPLVLSGLFAPTAGVRGLTDFPAEGTIRRQTIQSSSNEAGATVYSRLDDGPALGSFLYGYRMRYFLSTQWLANSESFTNEVEHYPLPLLQLKFSDWQLPVVLSSASASP